MRKSFHSWVLVAGLVLAAHGAMAAPVTFVTTGQSFQYKALDTDLWSNWAGANLATFDNFVATNPISGWATGNSAFGNNYSLPQATAWAADTDLALYTTFTLGGAASGNLTLNVASDNGFLVFLNDQLLAKENAEGYTSYWEYTFTNSSALLTQGTNVIKVLAEDHGGATFFDMRLTGNVPEPGSLALAGLALVGLAVARRRV